MTDQTEETGVLPDGTDYVIRVPRIWSGVVVRDLDAVSRSVAPGLAPMYDDMMARGWAVAGTVRHRLRMYQYDPRREIANLDRVLDRFDARFGRPAQVVQYGCSGGGHLTLAIAEDFHERVTAAVALAAHTPVWLMNSFLDGWFALQVLISPYQVGAAGGTAGPLAITGLENDGSAHPSGHGRTGPLPDAWRTALTAAQATPEGRARIALAFALGQWPAWVSDDVPKPALDDVPALQRSMFAATLRNAANPGGEARVMFENAANGQQLSDNTNVDYTALFEAANPFLRTAVRRLYEDAAVSLNEDLARINAAPRIAAAPHAIEFWSARGRTTRGLPAIPVLRLHMIGDYQIPPSLVEGYEALVRTNGREDLFRSAYVDATGHCNFTAAESTAAIQTVLDRVRQGSWPDTSPGAMNERAAELRTGTEPRFIDYGPHRHPRYNRLWLPEDQAQAPAR